MNNWVEVQVSFSFARRSNKDQPKVLPKRQMTRPVRPRAQRGHPGLSIRAARIMRGMTQKDLGARVGATAESIKMWEQGEAEPPTPAMQRCREILGMSDQSENV